MDCFLQYNSFKTDPHFSIWWLNLFYCWLIFHYMSVISCFYILLLVQARVTWEERILIEKMLYQIDLWSIFLSSYLCRRTSIVGGAILGWLILDLYKHQDEQTIRGKPIRTTLQSPLYHLQTLDSCLKSLLWLLSMMDCY